MVITPRRDNTRKWTASCSSSAQSRREWWRHRGRLLQSAKGLAFARNKAFNEGDHVILDKEPAIIVKVGVVQSVFGVTKPDGNYVWRYVPNERIDSLKLERIIFNHKPNENEAAINENAAKIEANMEKLTQLYDNMPK